jgi:hypothetical protein
VGDDIEIAGEPHTQSVSLTGIRRGLVRAPGGGSAS